MEASVSLIKNAEGQAVGFRGIVHDITERKKLEEQLRQAQKMETIGTLTGGVAHDFNNLLTVILGNAEFGLQDSRPEEPVYDDLACIQEAAIQARDLTIKLLSFGRKQVLNKKRLDINKTISELVKMLKRIIEENIILRTDLQSQLPPIWADPISIQQVLMNICVNARDAMPNGGQLMIRTRNIDASEMQALPDEIKRKPADYVRLSITDTEIGMDKTTLERLFEPFFTTKKVGKGTGLGLSVVYGIVKQHDGDLEVLSEPGKGTTFHIYFPVATEDNVPQQEEIKSIFRGQGETVLVVEDDEAVRNVGVRFLKTLGCNVMTANDGEEALDTFKKGQKDIDLVIMDVVMPKSSGPQVYNQMRALKPDLPVIFATGYDVNAELGDLPEDAPVAVLQKPFSKEKLAKKIQALLSGNNE